MNSFRKKAFHNHSQDTRTASTLFEVHLFDILTRETHLLT